MIIQDDTLFKTTEQIFDKLMNEEELPQEKEEVNTETYKEITENKTSEEEKLHSAEKLWMKKDKQKGHLIKKRMESMDPKTVSEETY